MESRGGFFCQKTPKHHRPRGKGLWCFGVLEIQEFYLKPEGTGLMQKNKRESYPR